MKYSIAFLIFLAVFSSCESHKSKKEIAASESPKEIVTAYIAATTRFDSETAKEFLILNEGNLMNLETLKKMEKSIPDDQKAKFLDMEKDIEYFEKEVTDSTSVIFATPKKEVAQPIEFYLKKVNKKWLIESVILH